MIKSKSESSSSKDYFSTDHLQADLKGRALRGVSATIIGQALSFTIQTIGTIILARLLTPHDFGLVTMVLAFSLLLQNFGVNGFIEAIIQRKEIHHKQISTLFWINAGLSLMLSLLFIASAPFISWFYKEPVLTPIAIVISSSILLAGLSTEHLALLKRGMKFFETTANDVIASLISITISIILALCGWGYWALVAKWVISPLVTTIGAWLLCGWRPGRPDKEAEVGPMLRFAIHTYGNFVMSYFSRNIDKILLGRVYGSQPLGFYDRAYHLANMLPNQILSPLHSVTLATFSRLADDHEKYRYTYLTVLSIISFISMPLSAALTLVGKDLILILLGPQWSEAGQIFCAFGPSIGVAIIYITHSWLHLSLGTPDRWFRWGIVSFIVTSICFLIGLQFGALGVAVAYSASFYILTGPALWYAGKPVDLRISSIFSTIWRYYVAALAAGSVCWFIMYSYGLTANIFAGINILLRVLISVVLCISIYLILVTFLFRSGKPITQCLYILREMIGVQSNSVEK